MANKCCPSISLLIVTFIAADDDRDHDDDDDDDDDDVDDVDDGDVDDGDDGDDGDALDALDGADIGANYDFVQGTLSGRRYLERSGQPCFSFHCCCCCAKVSFQPYSHCHGYHQQYQHHYRAD